MNKSGLTPARQLCRNQNRKLKYWVMGVSATHKLPAALSRSMRSTGPHKDVRCCGQRYFMIKSSIGLEYHPEARKVSIIYQKTLFYECRQLPRHSVGWPKKLRHSQVLKFTSAYYEFSTHRYLSWDTVWLSIDKYHWSLCPRYRCNYEGISCREFVKYPTMTDMAQGQECLMLPTKW